MLKQMRIPYTERPILGFGMLAAAVILTLLTKTYGPLLYWLSGPAAITALSSWYYSKRTNEQGEEINNDPTEMVFGKVFQYIWIIGLLSFAVALTVQVAILLLLG